jgi:hypothetical protein
MCRVSNFLRAEIKSFLIFFVNLFIVVIFQDAETNARPLQPINRRPVLLYRPSENKED